VDVGVKLLDKEGEEREALYPCLISARSSRSHRRHVINCPRDARLSTRRCSLTP